MALPNIFDATVVSAIINRIETLTNETPAKWGKMNVAQMLAHCNVTYEMVFEDKHKKPNFLLRFILRQFVKPVVVNEKPYSKNGKTAPDFIVSDQRDFQAEKNRLINYITKVQNLGENHFENKPSLSFGVLSKIEWNNMFYKHLDHHLSQFGV